MRRLAARAKGFKDLQKYLREIGFIDYLCKSLEIKQYLTLTYCCTARQEILCSSNKCPELILYHQPISTLVDISPLSHVVVAASLPSNNESITCTHAGTHTHTSIHTHTYKHTHSHNLKLILHLNVCPKH